MNYGNKTTFIVLLGALSLFITKIPGINEVVSSFLYGFSLILAFVFAVKIGGKSLFKSASLVVLGVFIGIIVDIIIFPTVDGFERNLFPLEALFHTAFGATICYISATIWYFSFGKNRTNT